MNILWKDCSYGESSLKLQSAVDMALDKDALFTPQVAPLTLPNGTVPGITSGVHKGKAEYLMVYRELADGTQHLLNPAVSQQYGVSSYQAVIETAESLFPNTTFQFSSYDNGKRITFTQSLDDSYEWPDGDKISQFLLWTSSMDSSYPSGVTQGFYRWQCDNGMATIGFEKARRIKARRTTNHDVTMITRTAVIAQANQMLEQFCQSATVLKSIEMTDRQFDEMFLRLFPEPEEGAHGRTKALHDRRRDGIYYFLTDEVEAYGATAWAFFNAVQSYEFHRQTKEDEQKQIRCIMEPQAATPASERFLRVAAEELVPA